MLSSVIFFAGGSLVMVALILLLLRNRPARIVARLSVLYFSLVLYTISAISFAYSSTVVNSTVPFYFGLALLILGAGGLLVGVRRNPDL